MLDNASGSVTILDIAQLMKNVNPTNHLRFIWFGGEEIGLLGSQYYVGNLSSTDLSTSATTSTPMSRPRRTTPSVSSILQDRDLFGGTSSSTFPNHVQGVAHRA
jgi:hypothetical protein